MVRVQALIRGLFTLLLLAACGWALFFVRYQGDLLYVHVGRGWMETAPHRDAAADWAWSTLKKGAARAWSAAAPSPGKPGPTPERTDESPAPPPSSRDRVASLKEAERKIEPDQGETQELDRPQTAKERAELDRLLDDALN